MVYFAQFIHEDGREAVGTDGACIMKRADGGEYATFQNALNQWRGVIIERLKNKKFKSVKFYQYSNSDRYDEKKWKELTTWKNII